MGERGLQGDSQTRIYYKCSQSDRSLNVMGFPEGLSKSHVLCPLLGTGRLPCHLSFLLDNP